MREYRVEDLFNGRNYIFQITAGRKLSDIRHSHNFYEIMLLLSGECTHVIEDKKYKMKRGSFVFMLPGENHFFENQAQDTNLLGLSVTVNEFEKFVIAYGKEFLAEIKREKVLNIAILIIFNLPKSKKDMRNFPQTFKHF